jgi:hypothetical protein
VTCSKIILPYRPTNLTGIMLFIVSMFVRLGARPEAYNAGDVAENRTISARSCDFLSFAVISDSACKAVASSGSASLVALIYIL